MFPLGSVVVPHMLLPLHVFEPRYRILFEELVGELPRPDDQASLGSEPRFGVTMIERGSEVGGGEVRAAVGTLATVVGAQLAEDGRWAVVAVGGERIRVLNWLDDDPYPRAEVDLWPDEDPPDLNAALAGSIPTLLERHAELSELMVQLGVELEPGEAGSDVPDAGEDPDRLIWQLALASPLGSLDRYRLLSAPGSVERATRLVALLDEQIELVRARLG
jgi:Lon protease-like protein